MGEEKKGGFFLIIHALKKGRLSEFGKKTCFSAYYKKDCRSFCGSRFVICKLR